MALVKCNECGKTISETATKCPHCGAGHLKAVGSSEGQKVLGFILIIIGIGLLLFFLNAGYSDPEKPVSVYFLCIVIIIVGIWVLSAKGKQKIEENK